MDRPYRYVDVERHDGAACVRFRQKSFDDAELEALGAEIGRIVDEEGCRRLVLILGPEHPQFLYSVFLAKLVNLQKRLESDNGHLALAKLSPATHAVFQAAGLEHFFAFYPDAEAALGALRVAHPV
jgi:anti-anti-sigma factor